MAADLGWFKNGAPVEDEETGLLNIGVKPTHKPIRTGTVAKRDDSLREFLQKMAGITKELKSVRDKFNDLQYTYEDSLVAATAEQIRTCKADLEASMQDIKATTQALLNKVKSLQTDIGTSESDPGTLMQKKAKAADLELELRNFTNEFFRFQTRMRDERRKEYRSKLKAYLNKEPTDEEVDKWAESGDDSALYASLLQDQSRPAVQKVLGDIQERYRAAKKLQTDIEEVTKLFHQLQAIVVQQGEQIETLAKRLNKAADYIGTATSKLEDTTYIKTTVVRTKLIWSVGIAVAIAVIVAVILGTVFGIQPVK